MTIEVVAALAEVTHHHGTSLAADTATGDPGDSGGSRGGCSQPQRGSGGSQHPRVLGKQPHRLGVLGIPDGRLLLLHLQGERKG